MLNILSNRTYRHLFMAQVIALIGTGLATVALGYWPTISQVTEPGQCWVPRWLSK
jgi:hypothetical protein